MRGQRKICGMLDDNIKISNNPEDRLDDLLCIIHRDGGQYIADHGPQKAYEDGLRKVSELHSELEDTRRDLDNYHQETGLVPNFRFEHVCIENKILKNFVKRILQKSLECDWEDQSSIFNVALIASSDSQKVRNLIDLDKIGYENG